MPNLVPATLTCPSCSAAIPASDVNVAAALAVCRACDVTYTLGDAAPEDEAPDLPVPPSVTVERDGGVLVLEKKWDRKQGLTMGAFFVVWDGFLVFWYGMAWMVPGPMKLLPLLFPVLHVAGGVWGTWNALANLFNTTRVEARRRVLKVKIGPISTGGEVTHDVGDTVQFFVDRNQKGLQLTGGGQQNSETFRVCAFQRDGTAVPVIERVATLAEARAIERLLEKHYRMKDVPLRGEIPRSEDPVVYPEASPKVPAGGGSLSMAKSGRGGEVAVADREAGNIALKPVPKKEPQR